MIGNDEWKRYLYTLSIDSNKKVKHLDISIEAEDVEGQINMTDIQVQDGLNVTGNIPSTSDILEPVSFNIDETIFLGTVSNPVKKGTQPIHHKEVDNRFYNIVGRGHEVISIPNVFHENYTFPLVTTGLDIELYAKEDFDLLRIRTMDGGLVPGRKYDEIPQLKDHPLNYKYTREFYFDGGKAGEKIELKASINSAKLSNTNIPLKKHNIKINGSTMKIERQRFMLAPPGSFRIGIEFYKQVEETTKNDYGETVKIKYLKDVGIGYYGIAELKQWTFGVSKL